jgi:hypothetical protein
VSDPKRDLVGIDIDQIERVENSHLGPYHTKLIMKGGEVVTVAMERADVMAKFVTRHYGNMGGSDEE